MLNCLSVGAPGQAARPRKRGGDGYNDWPTESDDAPRERGGDSLPIHRFRQFVALARPRKRGGGCENSAMQSQIKTHRLVGRSIKADHKATSEMVCGSMGCTTRSRERKAQTHLSR